MTKAINFSFFQLITEKSIICIIISISMFLTVSIFICATDCSPHNRIRHEFQKSNDNNNSSDSSFTYYSHHRNYNNTNTKFLATINSNVHKEVRFVQDVRKSETNLSRTPPSYLSYMYDTLAANTKSQSHEQYRPYEYSAGDINTMEDQTVFNKNEPIIRAILPANLTSSRKSAIIIYNLTRKNLGEFNRANIILTLKDEISVNEDSSVNIFVTIKNYQVKQSLTIHEESKFYSFDVSNILRNKIKEFSTTWPNEDDENDDFSIEIQSFRIECKISQSVPGRRMQFHQIFDTSNEAPFILLRFHQMQFSTGPLMQSNRNYFESLKSQENWTIHHAGRNKRSATTAVGSNGSYNMSRIVQLPLQCFCPNQSIHLQGLHPTQPSSELESQIEESTLQRETANETVPSVQRNSGIGNSTVSVSTKPNIVFVATNVTEGGLKIGNRLNYPNHVSKRNSSSINMSQLDNAAPTTTSKPLYQKLPYPSLTPPSPTVCRKHEWLVKPSDISLDNVVKPEFLDLGYCAGSCPFPLENDVFNFSLHSYFADQYRFYKGFETPVNLQTSQCVAVTYKKLMIMVKESDGGFVVIVLEDASVDSCGCR